MLELYLRKRTENFDCTDGSLSLVSLDDNSRDNIRILHCVVMSRVLILHIASVVVLKA